MTTIAYAINYAAIGVVFLAAIVVGLVGAALVCMVIRDRIHALIWRARRNAAKAAPREREMVIPTAHGR